ncbi:MAG: phosphotransferase family protein [Pseudomonadota bacterium]
MDQSMCAFFFIPRNDLAMMPAKNAKDSARSPMTETADATFSGTGETPDHLKFDEARLGAYLADTLSGFSGPLTVKKFKGGQSNPTYLLETPGRSYVLRRKPPGKLLKSAHAVDREYRVMTALGRQNFPVPQTYLLCEDETIVGTPFFVMEHVDGRIFWDATIPQLSKPDRTALYLSMADTIADLHTTNIEAAQLTDYGKHGAYFSRQISRWSGQYKDSETDQIDAMDHLINWLPHHVPAGDETVIVHGDFRLDNLIVHPIKPEILAVLDWELSTLGHPLADFTYFLMTWNFPTSVRGGLSGLDLGAIGIPTIEAMTDRYCQRTGRADLLSNPAAVNFCFAYNMFRLAAIAQGVYKRGLQGNASSDQSTKIAAQIPALASLGWMYAQKAGAPGSP